MSNPLIVALDVPSIEEATALAKTVGDAAGAFKVGMELFYAAGPEAVRSIDGDVFLDLKLHDIPNTVARATKALSPLAPAMLNVHALGGDAMIRAALDAKSDRTKLLAVTILTSLSDEHLAALRLPPAREAVPYLASVAVAAGCDGIVCSPADLPLVRGITPEGFLLVTPGVRPAGSESGDQARIATPRDAIANGATHIVVGRPINAARDPRAAAEAILRDLRA
jgi:orotidine-5'-phosphate decarboxylase